MFYIVFQRNAPIVSQVKGKAIVVGKENLFSMWDHSSEIFI